MAKSGIIIGERGDKIKLIGKEASIDMENLFHISNVNLWIKSRFGWSEWERALSRLGSSGRVFLMRVSAYANTRLSGQ